MKAIAIKAGGPKMASFRSFSRKKQEEVTMDTRKWEEQIDKSSKTAYLFSRLLAGIGCVRLVTRHFAMK